MLKKALLLFTLLLFTGCVERGYELTVNKTTHTITAVKSIDIRKNSQDNTTKDIEKMNAAVNKEQKKQAVPTSKKTGKVSKKPVETKKQKLQTTSESEKKKQEKTNLVVKKKQEETTRLDTEKKKQIEEERKALEQKLSREKEEKRLSAETQREALVKKEATEKRAQEAKMRAMKAMKEKKAQEALRLKLEKAKAVQALKIKEEKIALERKIAKERQIQIQKEKREKDALEVKLSEEKKQRVAAAKAKKIRIQKEEAQRIAKIKEEKALQAHKIAEDKKASLSKTETLIFKPSAQTYQKFGTSEIHGHVVYLTPSGQEIGLQNTKIYLVPKNTKTDYWYKNYYLKDREAKTLSNTVVRYLNATHLNIEKNFAFYGLAPGTYYIIIESSYPASISKNKKVYIAKKINVEKYKKIMTVFSKRL